MRSTSLFGLGLALASYAMRPVLAQAELPECAALCFQSTVMNQTVCAPTDIPCICTNGPLNAAIQGCVMGACTVKEGLVAVNITSTMCGVPVRDRTRVLFLTSTISISIAAAAVIIRMVVAFQQRSFGLDDVFCLAALAAAFPLSVLQSITPGLGFGKDTWAVSAENITTVLKYVYASQVVYFPSSGFTKLCFLYFFLRIFPAKNTQKIVYIFSTVSMMYTLGFGLTMVFACKPISAVWTSWMRESVPDYCINQNRFYLVAAAFNIAIDIAIVLIPIPELIKLKLSMRKKLFLVAIFSVGTITVVVSCIRLSAIATYATSANPLYDNMMSGTYSILEINIGILCICMPSFRRFLAGIVPCFATTTNSSNYKQYQDGTPNVKISTGKLSSRKKSTMGGSLFDTAIMKTVDTTVETRSHHNEDEVRLVQLQKNGKSIAESTGSTESQIVAAPCAYHENARCF